MWRILFILLGLNFASAASAPEEGLQGSLSQEQVEALALQERALREKLVEVQNEFASFSLEKRLERIQDFVDANPSLFQENRTPSNERYSVYVLRRALLVSDLLKSFSPDQSTLRFRIWRVSILKAIEVGTKAFSTLEFAINYAWMLRQITDTAVHRRAQFELMRKTLEFLQVDLSRAPQTPDLADDILRIQAALGDVQLSVTNREWITSTQDLKRTFGRVVEPYLSGIKEDHFTGKRVKKLVLDGHRNCALLEDGSVRCWGHFFRMIGDHFGPNLSEPTEVPGLEKNSDIEDLFIDEQNRICVVYDGSHRIRCVGKKEDDEPNDSRKVPSEEYKLDQKIRSLASGGRQTCFLDEEERVWCIGKNFGYYREIVLGFSDVFNPRNKNKWTEYRRLLAGRKVRSLALGYNLGCLIDRKQKLRCWGDEFDVRKLLNRKHPLRDVGIPRRMRFEAKSEKTRGNRIKKESFSLLAVGSGAICAVAGEKRTHLWCRSSLYFGMRGGTYMKPEPHRGELFYREIQDFRRLDGVLGSIQALDIGWDATCLLYDDGRIHCFGKDTRELSSRFFNDVISPQSGDGTPFVQVAVGSNHACGLTKSGRVFCWGENSLYQINSKPLDYYDVDEIQEVRF